MQDSSTLLAIAALALFGWVVYVSAYRLFFHPLAKFPGPKLAALTTWYEGFYDVIAHKGRFTFELAALHKKYGPIVRIGPNEVHVKDSDYYFDLYNMGNRLDKYDWYYGMLGENTALFPTIRADVHKLRRNAVAPFFSTQAVARFHPKVQEVTDRFTERMQESIKRDEPIPLAFAFRCLSTDLICEYLFGKQLNLIESEDWGRYFYSSWRSLWEMSPLIRQFPYMLELFKMVPKSILAKTQPKAYKVLDMERQTDDWTRDLLAANPEDVKKQRFPTVLWEVAHTDALPEHEKEFKVLATGGNNLLATGFETTGMALSHLIYGVLANPNIHKRLYKELEDAIPDPSSIPSHQVLEKLPYLNVVVKEGIRQAVGAYGRLPRVNPKEDILYKDWVIPAGCAIGMSAYYILWDPEIFKDPGAFKPERWLDPSTRETLDRYYVAFGRGPRSCVGMNLAYGELYTVLATVIRRFPTLRLYETSPEDVEAIHDFFGGMWRFEDGKPGLQVKG